MALHCSGDILISIKPEYFQSIINGSKTVELRRRSLRIPAGTRVWIYETVPGGRVAATATVAAVVEDSPEKLWKSHGERAAISEQEFFWYFAGSETGCAILLGDVEPLPKPLTLKHLRKSLGSFSPPQFYKRLPRGGAELSLFAKSAIRKPS